MAFTSVVQRKGRRRWLQYFIEFNVTTDENCWKCYFKLFNLMFPGNCSLKCLLGDGVLNTWLLEHSGLSASLVQGHVLFWEQRGEKKTCDWRVRERERKNRTLWLWRSHSFRKLNLHSFKSSPLESLNCTLFQRRGCSPLDKVSFSRGDNGRGGWNHSGTQGRYPAL